MVFNNKAQGLPINTIILIAVGLLILVLFITFVLGGFKGLGGATNPNSQAMSAFSGSCQSYCSQASVSGSFPYEFCSSTTIIGGSTYTCTNQTAGPTSCTFTWANDSTATVSQGSVIPGQSAYTCGKA